MIIYLVMLLCAPPAPKPASLWDSFAATTADAADLATIGCRPGVLAWTDDYQAAKQVFDRAPRAAFEELRCPYSGGPCRTTWITEKP